MVPNSCEVIGKKQSGVSNILSIMQEGGIFYSNVFLRREVFDMAKLDKQWVEKWAKQVNEDKVLKVIGKYFNARFVIGIDEVDYLVWVNGGKIDKVTDEITTNELGWQFALRAPADSWNKFAEKEPPPMYNDIWAMAHPLHGKLKIEGDTIVFWQNLRALAWMLDIMRQA